MTIYNVAIIGCGMMGREHIQSLIHIPGVTIRYLCDPYVDRAKALLPKEEQYTVKTFADEHTLFEHHRGEIDVVVIATPNFLHTASLLLWGTVEGLSILVEKPVAVDQTQLEALSAHKNSFKANIWVGMEYRYMAPIQVLRRELPSVGTVRQITIRENRYPFLAKVGEWNRRTSLTGDTFVEKCCHFFDLFFLIGGDTTVVRCESLATRSVDSSTEMIDGGYVLLELSNGVMCCLELTMYAEGARFQEEIVITGDKGRLEAYLPEMSVYKYMRPDASIWTDRTEPPPPSIPQIFRLEATTPHEGYHHGSTYREWLHFFEQMRKEQFVPAVSLEDGMRAVECGLYANHC